MLSVEHFHKAQTPNISQRTSLDIERISYISTEQKNAKKAQTVVTEDEISSDKALGTAETLSIESANSTKLRKALKGISWFLRDWTPAGLVISYLIFSVGE
jgi:TnpA family transposase